MLRIIGGERRGAKLHTLEGTSTRPLRGRIRESLFNIIRPEIPGSVVLDLFAGTGSVGLEALSQGAPQATFVESDEKAASVIERNIGKLRFQDRCRIVQGRLPDILKSAVFENTPPADLVFIMPPYGSGLGTSVLTALTTFDRVAPQALAALEVQHDEPFAMEEIFVSGRGWRLEDDRTWGVTRIAFFRAF